MKLLCVHPGASYATGDVFHGFARALVAQGHDVKHYDLCTRLDDAVKFYRWRARKNGSIPITWEEALTKAAMDVIPQALYHQPDWVVIFSGMYFHPDFFILLKRAGVKVALVLSESPYDDEAQARVAPWADIVFTNERTSVAVLGRVNPNTHYLAHAYDPERSATGPIPDDTPAHDVLFIGTMFEERIALFEAVDWNGIDFAMYGAFSLLPSRHKLRRYIKGGIVDNRTAQHMYRAARINLNPYRTSKGYGVGVDHIAGAESLNPRALELAACGAFQLSDPRKEMYEVFGPITYGITYRDAQHLGEWVRTYLGYDQGRETIARGFPAKIEGHTYAARAAQLTATLAGHGVAPRDALATAAD
jgi:spore maturation protein CgeB